MALGAVIAAGLLWLFAALIIMPMNERSAILDRKIEKAERDLKEITRLANRYMDQASRLPKSRKLIEAGPLTTKVEKIARGLGVDKSIKRMSPVPSKSKTAKEELAVSISDLSFFLFVDFLQKLHESPSAINITGASVKTVFEGRENISAEITLSASF